MKPKLLIFLLIFISFLFFNGRATTIVVTSNADSGPGSLRNALLLAQNNGTAQLDSIVFQITYVDTASVTITIGGPLLLSSNIFIDGETEPGLIFGVSRARIIIQSAFPTTCLSGFVASNCSDVQIRGIWFRRFNGFTLSCNSSAIALNSVSNFYIRRCVFTENLISIGHYLNSIMDSVTEAKNIEISSSFFGLHPDGNTPIPEGGVKLTNGKDITIGGGSLAEGNYFGMGGASVTSLRSVNNGFVKMIGNIVGLNFQKTQVISNSGILNVTGTQFGSQRSDFDVSINYNELSHQFNAISVWYVNNTIRIMNNKAGRFSPPPSYDNSFGIGILHVTRRDIVHIVGNEVAGFQTGIFLASTDKITMQVNDAICNIRGIAYYQPVTPPPIVKITDIGTSYVKGKAPPLANVELFVNNQCVNYCENGVFYGSATADNNGDWTFPFSLPSGVITATAMDTFLYTSEFNSVKLDTINALVKNATCGANNGSITGIHILNATSWHWEDSAGQIVSLDTNLVNVGSGKYCLVLNEVNVNCPVITRFFEIIAVPQPTLSGNPFNMVHPNCGLNNGSIKFTGAYPVGSVNVWMNSTSNSLLYYSDSIGGLSQGTYYFKLYLYEDSTCNNVYGPFVLTNQSGPLLNTNGIQINNATCSNANGSITGITTTNVTGTPFIQWLDSLNNPVGSALNLTNIPAGKYKLKFKDQSGCDTIITPFYTIQSLGVITMDTSQLAVTSSQCAFASGTITGINVQGATNYQWINASGQTVSNSLSPGPFYPGSYTLIAANQYGCTKQTNPIIILPETQMSFNVPVQIQGRPGLCDSLNGYINIINFPNPQNYTFRWVDSLNPTVTISTSLNLTGFNSGTFILYAKNAAGCEQRVTKEYAPYLPPPVITSTAIITDEVCNNQAGSIQGVTVSPGTGMQPFSYTWYNSNNNVVSNQQNLSTAQAGSYTLIVTDNFGCKDTSNVLQIKNTIVSLNIPKYDDQYIRINTSTILSVLNPQPGTYLLFDSPNSTNPIQQNVQGIFTTPNLTADKIYYIQLVNGSCVSSKVAVKIYVYDKTNVYVPSGFTPNNDGKNDILKVRAYGIVMLEYFKVYNKYGQLIFSTSDISKGWDGTINGKQQSTSVFVWMVRAKDELTGEYIEKKGTVTLIR